MKIQFYLIILVILCSCEDPEQSCIPVDIPVKEIYIDSSCLPSDVEDIMQGIDHLNSMTDNNICQDTVNVVGTVNVKHDKVNPGTDVDVIACYNYEPSWYKGSKYTDWLGSCSAYSDITVIRLFNFKTLPGYRYPLIIHELGHYVGLKHIDNIKAAMYKNIQATNRKYTKKDVEAFRNIYL